LSTAQREAIAPHFVAGIVNEESLTTAQALPLLDNLFC